MKNPAASSGVSELGDEICLKAVIPEVFIGGLVRIRLDSRLRHAGMTEFGEALSLTQQAAGN